MAWSPEPYTAPTHTAASAGPQNATAANKPSPFEGLSSGAAFEGAALSRAATLETNVSAPFSGLSSDTSGFSARVGSSAPEPSLRTFPQFTSNGAWTGTAAGSNPLSTASGHQQRSKSMSGGFSAAFEHNNTGLPATWPASSGVGVTAPDRGTLEGAASTSGFPSMPSVSQAGSAAQSLFAGSATAAVDADLATADIPLPSDDEDYTAPTSQPAAAVPAAAGADGGSQPPADSSKLNRTTSAQRQADTGSSRNSEGTSGSGVGAGLGPALDNLLNAAKASLASSKSLGADGARRSSAGAAAPADPFNLNNLKAQLLREFGAEGWRPPATDAAPFQFMSGASSTSASTGAVNPSAPGEASFSAAGLPTDVPGRSQQAAAAAADALGRQPSVGSTSQAAADPTPQEKEKPGFVAQDLEGLRFTAGLTPRSERRRMKKRSPAVAAHKSRPAAFDASEAGSPFSSGQRAAASASVAFAASPTSQPQAEASSTTAAAPFMFGATGPAAQQPSNGSAAPSRSKSGGSAPGGGASPGPGFKRSGQREAAQRKERSAVDAREEARQLAQQRSLHCKNQGNATYEAARYAEAERHYTKAIEVRTAASTAAAAVMTHACLDRPPYLGWWLV